MRAKKTCKVLGIIPARGGSKGVLHKNLLQLGGKSILELAIEQARGSKLLHRFIVSTEDKELYRVAEKANAPLPFLRPESLAQDDSSTYSVVKHAVEWFEANENWRPDAVVILQPTTPFRKSEYIDAAIEKLWATSCDAVLTVCHPDYPPHWNLSMNEQGNLQCL
ncbi:MAG: acylneuraminate cytidylyltransferase family protein, partial [Bdellovibrionota bacterium]